MENKFWFLTKYSFLKKIKSKGFIIGNIIVLIIILSLVNVDSIVNFFGGDFNNDYTVKIVDNAGYYNEVKDELSSIKDVLEKSVTIKKEKNDLEKAKKKLKGTDDIILVINKDEDNILNAEFISDTYVDAVIYESISSSLTTAKYKIAVKDLNLSKEDEDKLKESVKVKRTFIDKEKSEDEEKTHAILTVASAVIVLPCFMLIMYLVQMIGAEINEEKSTRGMEIIIGNVSVKTHFFSKVLSSNLFVILQGILLGIYAFLGAIIRLVTTNTSKVASSAINNTDLNTFIEPIKNSGILDKLSYIIPLIIILLLLSFLAYSLLAGILASVTTNMENFSQLQTPLMVISSIGYYLILISTAFPGALFMKVIGVIPLVSITMAPCLLLSGQIGVPLMILAIILLIIFNYLLIKYGLRIYKVGILNYSETGLLKKMFKAIKQK